MEKLTEGILALLLDRVKHIDERTTEDAIELYALRHVLKSSLADFDARDTQRNGRPSSVFTPSVIESNEAPYTTT